MFLSNDQRQWSTPVWPSLSMAKLWVRLLAIWIQTSYRHRGLAWARGNGTTGWSQLDYFSCFRQLKCPAGESNCMSLHFEESELRCCMQTHNNICACAFIRVWERILMQFPSENLSMIAVYIRSSANTETQQLHAYFCLLLLLVEDTPTPLYFIEELLLWDRSVNTKQETWKGTFHFQPFSIFIPVQWW